MKKLFLILVSVGVLALRGHDDGRENSPIDYLADAIYRCNDESLQSAGWARDAAKELYAQLLLCNKRNRSLG